MTKEEILIALATVGAFLLILALGCVLADYVLPHWKWLNKQIDKLPLMWGKK